MEGSVMPQLDLEVWHSCIKESAWLEALELLDRVQGSHPSGLKHNLANEFTLFISQVHVNIPQPESFVP